MSWKIVKKVEEFDTDNLINIIILFDMSQDREQANKDFLFRFGCLGNKHSVDEAEIFLNKLQSDHRNKLEKSNSKLISWTKNKLQYQKFFQDIFMDNLQCQQSTNLEELMRDIKSQWREFKRLKQETIKCLDHIPQIRIKETFPEKIRQIAQMTVLIEKIMGHLSKNQPSLQFDQSQKSNLQCLEQLLFSKPKHSINTSSLLSLTDKYQKILTDEIFKLKMVKQQFIQERNSLKEKLQKCQQKGKRLEQQIKILEGFKVLYSQNQKQFCEKIDDLEKKNESMREEIENLSSEMSELKTSFLSSSTLS